MTMIEIMNCSKSSLSLSKFIVCGTYKYSLSVASFSILSVDSSSLGVLVNIKQNYGWIDNLNYALNVDGYSNFGGVQLNGQDTNNIYKRMGDLTIGVGEINSIVLKTNSGYWETMRLNPYGVSINTSLYITGFTTFNNAITSS
jgi:hypothetical protein